MSVTELRLRPQEDRRLRAGHLWVFSNEVAWDAGPRPAPGAPVRVVAHSGRPMGLADAHPGTLITARLQPRLPVPAPDAGFWSSFFLRRLEERRRWLGQDRFCRLVHGEGDLVPGLVVDRLGDVAIVEALTAAMESRLDAVAEGLSEAASVRGMVFPGGGRWRALEGIERSDRVHGDVPPCIEVELPGGAFASAFPLDGQKTGFFLDQALNREEVARLCAGRTILDVFCYTGAWGLAALRRGARHVTFIDRDDSALAAASRQASFQPHQTIQADGWEGLEALDHEARRFDVVILDPPALAKSRMVVRQALAGYERLARLGARVTAPKGILVACSCSGLVDAEGFQQATVRGLHRARREARLLMARGASPDHPIHPAMPETSYLKVLVFALDD